MTITNRSLRGIALLLTMSCPLARAVGQRPSTAPVVIANVNVLPQILALKAAVAAGRVFGPTLRTSGPYVNEPFVTTPDEVERAAVDQHRAGYDFVKLHGDLSRAAYARLNAVARREGIRIVGNAPRNLGLAAMFEERQYALAHAEEFLYDRNNTLDAVLARPEMQVMPAPVRAGWGPATNPYTNRFGKDTYPGIMARYHLLEKLVRGFPGGQHADLLLLEANPLEKIANSRRIAGVMLRGQWLSRADLDSILAQLASPAN
jgi:hypothetical protein